MNLFNNSIDVLWCDSYHHTFLNFFSHSFLSFTEGFITATLKSFSVNSTICFLSQAVTVGCPGSGSYFPMSLHVLEFFVGNWTYCHNWYFPHSHFPGLVICQFSFLVIGKIVLMKFPAPSSPHPPTHSVEPQILLLMDLQLWVGGSHTGKKWVGWSFSLLFSWPHPAVRLHYCRLINRSIIFQNTPEA